MELLGSNIKLNSDALPTFETKGATHAQETLPVIFDLPHYPLRLRHVERDGGTYAPSCYPRGGFHFHPSPYHRDRSYSHSTRPAFDHGQQLGPHPPGDVAQRPQL